MKKILAVVSVVAGLAVGIYAADCSSCKQDSKAKEGESGSQVEKKRPKTVEEFEKIIAEKKAQFEKAVEPQRAALLKEIKELEQDLFNLKEWKRSNKE